MKKVIVLGLLFLLFTLMTACTKDIPNTNTTKDNVLVLNKETIQGFEQGILIGTPLRLDRKIRLADVKKIWGKYQEMYDHEDIHTFVYTVKNRRIVIDEDELKTLYLFQVEIGITKDEILQKMGNPTQGKKKGKSLVYQEKDYRVTFRELDDKTWSLIIFKAPQNR